MNKNYLLLSPPPHYGEISVSEIQGKFERGTIIICTFFPWFVSTLNIILSLSFWLQNELTKNTST